MVFPFGFYDVYLLIGISSIKPESGEESRAFWQLQPRLVESLIELVFGIQEAGFILESLDIGCSILHDIIIGFVSDTLGHCIRFAGFQDELALLQVGILIRIVLEHVIPQISPPGVGLSPFLLVYAFSFEFITPDILPTGDTIISELPQF